MAESVSRTLLVRLATWALRVRLASLLVLLLLPLDVLARPAVMVAVALVAGWSLVWLLPGGRVPALVERHPSVAVLDALVAAVVTGLVGVDSPVVFVTLSTALVVGLLVPTASAWLVTVVLVAGYLLAALGGEDRTGLDLTYVVVIPATFVVLAVLGGTTRRLHLALLEEQGRTLAVREDAAAARERARLARDMHDSVAKSLHGMALAAAALPEWMRRDTEVAAHQAQVIQDAARQASAEARALLGTLRDEGPEVPLVERLDHLVRAYDARSGAAVTLSTHGVSDLCPRTADEVVAVAAEALENAHRHARARHVEVSLSADADGVCLEVVDDGRGFDPGRTPRGHYGLTGMRERADVADGTLEVDSSRRQGTRVRLVVPAQDARPRTEGADA